MSRILIVSNRLPVTVRKNGDSLEFIESIGGLTTGLKSFHEDADSLWVGWPGISDEELTPKEKRHIERVLRRQYKCLPVFLSQAEMTGYYYGFCNKTIWPLFHYFSSETEYNPDTWQDYKKINRKFHDRIRPLLGAQDIVWVHDYQLMLLPAMIRSTHPTVSVGFFLHIPFPSAEIFRLLVWRTEILHGLLGADLVGFHTYDYVRHFLSGTSRILGLEDKMNLVGYDDRLVKVDAFPMGIDYERFAAEYDFDKLAPEIREMGWNKGCKTILSIDRLDYTKGIPQRIQAFKRFLSLYPKYQGKVRLSLIVAPSRTEIDNYENLLREIRELVGEVNGMFGTFQWMPVWFLYKSFSQEEMIAFYRNADVLLVTPLRDGMNLIAKEYVAARTDLLGMLVLSETAGAASELAEAVIVNPNDSDSIAQGIRIALEMSPEEKVARNTIMNQRLSRYNVEFWAEDFLGQLRGMRSEAGSGTTTLAMEHCAELISAMYREADRRILFLDYDGTLVGFKTLPEQARPDEALMRLLHNLALDPGNTVVLISGRDRGILGDWFGDIPELTLVASHGLWLRRPGERWVMTAALDNEWKDAVRPILQRYSDRMPGSFIEEKEFALALHYRGCDPDMARNKIFELRQTLNSMIKSSTLMIQEGSKVLELKDNRFNKGSAASLLTKQAPFDFFLGAGDDVTDEDLFRALPPKAVSIKVGAGETAARCRVKSWQSLRELLAVLTHPDQEH